MATESTKKLREELEQARKAAQSLLDVYSLFTEEIKKSGKEISKALKGLDLGDSKDIEKLNKLLIETQKLTNEQIKINQESAKWKTQLNDILKQEKKLRESTKKTLSEEEKLRIKITKAQSEEGKKLAKLRQELTQINKEQRDAAKVAAEQSDAYKELTRNTNEAQANLKRLSAEFGVSSKEAKAARKEFEKFDKQLREINEDAKDGRRDVGRYKAEVRELADEMKNAANKAGGFGDILSTVTSPVGVASAAAAGLGAAFASTEKGGNKLKDTISQLEGGFNAVTSSVGGFVSSLLDGESVTDAYDNNIKGVTKRIEEQAQANLEATQAQRQNRIDLRETSQELAVLRGEYELLAQQAGDATTTLEAQNEATVRQAEKAAEITDKEISLLDKEIEAINLQIKAREGLNNQDLLDERQELINQQIELEGQLTAELATISQERRQIEQDQFEQRLDFLFDASDRQKTITEAQIQDESRSTEERLNLFKSLSDGIKETYAEIEREFREASGQQINIAEFANLEAKEQAKLLETLNLSEIERNRLKEAVVEYLQVVQDLDETQRDLNDAEFKTLSLQNEIAIQRRKLAGEQIELDADLTNLKKKELQTQIDNLEENSIERLEKEKELNDLLLKEQEKSEKEKLEAKKKADEEKKKQDDKAAEDEKKRNEEIKEAYEKSIEAVDKLFSDFYDKRDKEIAKNLESNLSAQERVKKGIEIGNEDASKSLSQLEEQEAKLKAKQEANAKAAQRSEAAIALLKAYGEKANEPNAAAKVIGDYSLILSAIQQVPAFIKGTELVSEGVEGAVKLHNGTDGYLARFDGRERILSPEQNKELSGISNSDVVSIVKHHRNNVLSESKGTTINTLRTEKLERKLDEVVKAIHNQPKQSTNYDAQNKYFEDIVKAGNKTERIKTKARGTWA